MFALNFGVLKIRNHQEACHVYSIAHGDSSLLRQTPPLNPDWDSDFSVVLLPFAKQLMWESDMAAMSHV